MFNKYEFLSSDLFIIIDFMARGRLMSFILALLILLLGIFVFMIVKLYFWSFDIVEAFELFNVCHV